MMTSTESQEYIYILPPSCRGCRHWREYKTERESLLGWGECMKPKDDDALIYGVYRTYATFSCAHAEISETPIIFPGGGRGG